MFAADAERERRLPIDGRAATMIRLPGWKPDVSLSSSRKPDGDAGDVDAGLVERGDPLEALLQQLLDVAELALDASLREVEEQLLGLVEQVGRLARPLPAEPRDLLPARISPRSVPISWTMRA